MVPTHTVCVDCWLPSPQQRQDEFDRLRHALDRSQRVQRDRFAEAALTRHAPAEAWGIADAMMQLRERRPPELVGLERGDGPTPTPWPALMCVVCGSTERVGRFVVTVDGGELRTLADLCAEHATSGVMPKE